MIVNRMFELSSDNSHLRTYSEYMRLHGPLVGFVAGPIRFVSHEVIFLFASPLFLHRLALIARAVGLFVSPAFKWWAARVSRVSAACLSCFARLLLACFVPRMWAPCIFQIAPVAICTDL